MRARQRLLTVVAAVTLATGGAFAAATVSMAATGTLTTSGTSGDINSPQPLSNADMNTGGANGQCPGGGVYCSTRDGSPSMNGNDNSQSNKPCAGCVGKADNKNPPGQEKQDPLAIFPNNGYECDANQGIGQTNPAHTGCGPIS
jgi:hypothetical protein